MAGLIFLMTTHPVSGTLGYTDGSNPHALITIGSDTWTYDANGNVLTTGDLALDWTYDNRLESSKFGADVTVYGYDVKLSHLETREVPK